MAAMLVFSSWAAATEDSEGEWGIRDQSEHNWNYDMCCIHTMGRVGTMKGLLLVDNTHQLRRLVRLRYFGSCAPKSQGLRVLERMVDKLLLRGRKSSN